MKYLRQIHFSTWTGTIIYALFGVGWIVGGYLISDQLYAPNETSLFELFKGLSFILITSLLVFVLMGMRSAQPDAAEPTTDYTTALNLWLSVRQRSYWWLIAAAAAIALGIFLAAYLVLEFARQETLQHEEDHASNLVHSVSSQIGASLKTVDLILHDATENRLLKSEAPGVELQRLQQAGHKYVSAIWLLDQDGKVIQESGTGSFGHDLSAQAFFVHHIKNTTTEIFLSKTAASRGIDEPLVCASRGIWAEDGEFRGAVCAVLTPTQFLNFWQLPLDEKTVEVALLNRQNEWLLNSPAIQDIVTPMLNSTALATDENAITTIEDANGKSSLVAIASIAEFPDLRAVVQIPLLDRIEVWRVFSNSSLAINFGIMIVLFGILYLLLRQFRKSEALERSVIALARYPMNNINPVLTISAAGEFEFLNPAAVRLMDSLADTHALDQLKQELLNLSKGSSSGLSDLSIDNMVLQVSTVIKDAGDCDFYLTDVTLSKSRDSILDLFYELPFLGMAVTSATTQEWVRVNDALCEILGYPREELTKLTWTEITHPDDLDADLEHFNRILTGESEGYRIDKRFIRRDRAIIDASIDVRVVRRQSGEIQFFVATIQDITERKRANDELRRQKNLYVALSATNHAIARTSSSREAIFQLVCQAAVDHTGFVFGWIGEIDAASGLLQPVASYGNDDGYVNRANVSIRPQDPQGEGPAGRAARTSKRVVVLDVEHDESMAPWKNDLRDRGIQALASFPIVRPGGIFGTFTVYATSAEIFSNDSIALLDEMAIELGFAIEKLSIEQTGRESSLALAASEERFRSAIAEAPLPIMLHAEDGEVLSCNKSWLEITGYSLDEIATIDKWTELAYGEKQTTVKTEIDSLYGLSKRKDEGEFPICCKDGEIRTWDFSSVGLGKIADGRHLVMSMAADVTERLASLTQLADAEEKFRGLVEQSVAGIFMLDEDKLIYGNPRSAEILGLPNTHIDNADLDLESVIDPKDLPTIREQVKAVIEGVKPRVDLEFNALRNSGGQVRVGAQASLASHEGRPVLLGTMQDITEKSRADAQIAESLVALRAAFLGTVEVAISMGQMRDPYTAGHERNVSRIAVAMAAEMGLQEEQIEGIRVGGLLHDIGKISIPAEILAKPGRLTSLEFELVKTHAQSSYDLLKSVNFPWPVAEMAWEHHERLDGSGYPRGIKGDEIIIEARILAVADVVEAISSHRPYRPSLGLSVALEEIRNGAGITYDKRAVAACLKLFEEQGFEINAA